MIYCVEDDAAIRDIEVYALRSTGFEAEGLGSGEELFAAIKKRMPELIILDVMLPGEDGLEILKRIRFSALTRSVPVIMATARGEEYDKITGLDAGADDYLVKPFGMMEMVSRVRAVLRRSGGGQSAKEGARLSLGPLSLDTESHTVSVDGRPVTLTLKEFDLLKALMRHEGQVLSRDQLLEDVWGVTYAGGTRTVDVHVQTLRQKLGEHAGSIETVRGVGYRFAGQEG